jgi:hypothetical protein
MAMIVLTPVIGLIWGLYQIRNRKYESLNDSIAVLVPDTVHHWDTVPPVDSIRWIDSLRFHYATIYDTITGDSLNFYNDSIVNEELAIYFREKVDGLILDREIGYRLKVPKIIETTTTITEPYPVIQKGVSRTGLYYGFGLRFGREGFAGSAGIDVLTKKNIMYGAEYLRTESRGYLILNVKFKL